MKDKIYKYRYKLIFLAITIISLYVRYICLFYESNDYVNFLSKWFIQIQENGGVKALNEEIGDYNTPYLIILSILTYLPIKSLYSIKMVSIIFDYICAIIVMKISNIINEGKNKGLDIFLYGVIILLPTVILNSSCWGQCDSIYTTFIMLSIYYLLKEKRIKAFIFLGVAFSFKLQTVFILPLYVLYLSKKRVSIYNFVFIPIVYLIMCLPALIQGRTLLSCLGIYSAQCSEYNNFLSMNFPNLWTLIYGFQNQEQYNYFVLCSDNIIFIGGIINTMLIYISMFIMVCYKKIEFDKKKIIEVGLWSICVATFFLPCMHDRYLYTADILSWIYLLYNKEKWYIPISIQVISLSTYITYLIGWGGELYYRIVSLIFFVVVIDVTKDIYIKYIIREEKKDEVYKKI